jgi:anti-sigma factor (TIGR02949 family)
MMRKLKRWLGRKIWPDSVRCPEEERCLELARLMLDKEASDSDAKYVMQHIDGCYQCYDNYDVEKAIREVVKKKDEHKEVPVAVVEEIRKKIDVA